MLALILYKHWHHYAIVTSFYINFLSSSIKNIIKIVALENSDYKHQNHVIITYHGYLYQVNSCNT